jgi:hypothetical protein
MNWIHKIEQNTNKAIYTLYLARGGAFGLEIALQSRRLRVPLPLVSLEFFIDINLPAAMWHWGRFNLLT